MSGPYADYHPSLDDPNAWVPYRYYPSLAAAAVFTVLFGLITIWHGVLLGKYRTWCFIPFLVGGILQFAGYIGRIVSSDDIWALGPYIVQSILLLVAPALYAASIYMLLGRIIVFVKGEHLSVVPTKWLTKAFVIGDVIAFLTQMGGGGIQAGGTLSLLHAGEKIIIVGLFLQIAFFGFFIVVAITFHRRANRPGVILEDRPIWKRHIHALYWGSGLIMVRSVFRVIEYLMGNNGFLLRNEYFLYIFDATLMFIVMVGFAWVHPSQITRVMAQDDAQEHKTRSSRRWRPRHLSRRSDNRAMLQSVDSADIHEMKPVKGAEYV